MMLSELLPHFIRSGWVLILPIPLAMLWLMYRRHRRTGYWHQLLPTAFQRILLTEGPRTYNSLSLWLLGLGWLLAVFALAGPAWQSDTAQSAPSDPLVVVLELTPELYATDGTPQRLQQAQHKILDLLRARRGLQTAIVVFAGTAHTLVPLSDDLATAQNLLRAIKPSLLPESGHRADLGVAKAHQLIEQAGQGSGRVLLITSQLNETERQAISRLPKDHHHALMILGLGTAQGAPLMQENGHFLQDTQGAIRVARLDQEGLALFAHQQGARYHQATLDDSDLTDLHLADAPSTRSHTSDATQSLTTWQDQGYWLLLPLLILAAGGARKGWLFCLALVFSLPPSSAQAADWTSLWKTPDQQGWQLLQQHEPQAAAQHFQDPQWQGIAYYRAGLYAKAAESFGQSQTATAHYNRGNALALNQQPEAALRAYDQALQQQPTLTAAQHNKAVVEQWLQQDRPDNNPTPTTTTEPTSNATPTTTNSMAHPSLTAPEQSDPAQSENTTPSEGHLTEAESGTDPWPAVETLEQQQALDQWLRRIPDDPSELLRRKFLYEQRQH